MSSFQNGSSPRSRNAAESDIEAGTSARRSDDLDGGDFSDPFDIARTKNASVERLRRWRVRFLFYFSLSDVLFIIVFFFFFLTSYNYIILNFWVWLVKSLDITNFIRELTNYSFIQPKFNI